MSWRSGSGIRLVPGGALASSSATARWAAASSFSLLNLYRYLGTLPYPFLWSSCYSFSLFLFWPAFGISGLGPCLLPCFGPAFALRSSDGRFYEFCLDSLACAAGVPFFSFCAADEFLGLGGASLPWAAAPCEPLALLCASRIASNSSRDLPL